MKKINSLVSVVIPVYNAAVFIAETIETVLNQTYSNLELILVDDGSNDDSVKIIQDYARKDRRIKLIKNDKNSGVAVSRNNGVKSSSGRYVAFLDADDLWSTEKISKQVDFFRQHKDIAFLCTSYQFADAKGRPNGAKVIVKPKITYDQLVKDVTVWTSTVMFDMTMVSKKDIEMPNLIIGQDFAAWLSVIKKVKYVYGLSEILAYYRRTSGSLSANKIKAIKSTWNLYRNVECFSIAKSFLYITAHSYNATRRRIG